MVAIAPKFSYVRELENEFLTLFPHRFDYIYAPHPEPGQSPAWQTESRYPLADRLIQQGGYLFGVRFGTQTHYSLLDIDIGSVYHPRQDPFAIPRMLSALETIGLVAFIGCTSSYSGGLHLYFPFPEVQNSWEVAAGMTAALETAGFKVAPGQLEVFPDSKPFRAGTTSLFNAHRLPLQLGSYLLNADFQPIWSSQNQFVRQWRSTQNKNFLNRKLLQRVLKQAKRSQYRLSGKADKFIHDLDTEIEMGWTGHGQTNRLLGRITLRTYIFHHAFTGQGPLQGEALVNQIVMTARSLPGYTEWCRHQHEIEKRAEEWARCVESSHYFRYGDRQGKYKSIQPEPSESSKKTAEIAENLPTWNQKQSTSARERIRKAIADLLEKEKLPAGITARFQVLTQDYQIGGGSLYRHRDLWHPDFLSIADRSIHNSIESNNEPTEEIKSKIAVTKSSSKNNEFSSKNNDSYPNRQPSESCERGIANSPSLLSAIGGNTLCDEPLSDFASHTSLLLGGNPLLCKNFGTMNLLELRLWLLSTPSVSVSFLVTTLTPVACNSAETKARLRNSFQVLWLLYGLLSGVPAVMVWNAVCCCLEERCRLSGFHPE